ncbi:nitrous oxide reductase accessory protein NosL [Reinekea blandensis]|uniref:Hypothetical nosL protein n=1 Tax=Reinekea blandensis MED297 TaxID=314283 RepID=A4BIK6_9GAMM|nr:nitrous oxide reductase accessory protein NosL [Reinekea blandensis]EAR08085.1 hypothetical nosL protein [Reinekea sp. MED297] [Reinekea blandensis MED297]
MKAFLSLMLSFVLLACADDTPNTVIEAATIERSDQCHLCGMMIAGFPGPKGELVTKGATEVSKFCSTRDLFAFYLQPENQHRVIQLYVHDMSRSPWASPDDDHFIDARDAFYVVGSEKKGAMGDTLASFSSQSHAATFADTYGGTVYGFEDITLERLNASSHSMEMSGSEMMSGELMNTSHDGL